MDRREQGLPVLTFTHHWLNREELGLGYPLCAIGMEVQMADFCLEVSLHIYKLTTAI